VDFEWDAAKSAANFAKHRIYFVDAGAVLEDDFALTMRDLNDEEERWITLGTDALGRVLVVVYTWRGQQFGSSRRDPRLPARDGNMRKNDET
jgi:uncharacterized protein